MEHRTKDTYRTQLYEFIRDVLVECPACAGRAVVYTRGYTVFQQEANDVRLVCGQCGHNKALDRRVTRNIVLKIGAPIDPFFHLPLWLKMELGEHLLWAYNLDHLDFLARHVGAQLRERNGFRHQVKSIGARLPRWMTAAKRREAVLRAIGKLRERG